MTDANLARAIMTEEDQDLYPRSFVLRRHTDVTGVSGTGVVAWGCLFPDGVVALRWTGGFPTSVVFHDRGIDAVKAVHGHDGMTEIVWADAEE